MQLNIKNETSALRAVVLGQPGSIGPVPTIDRVFDAKSYESVNLGVYPTEEAIYKESSTCLTFFIVAKSNAKKHQIISFANLPPS